ARVETLRMRMKSPASRLLRAAWVRCLLIAAAATLSCAVAPLPVPDKLVVLTFADAVESHRRFDAPLLKEAGFSATFFVTHRWMDDAANFMTWDEIGELHQLGFEIGNHSWTHANFSQPKVAARLPEELGQVERALAEAKPSV